MAKHSTRAEREGDTRYLFVYKWELDCPAYRALSGDQVRVYQDIRVRYNGSNNGSIKYSARRAGEVIHKHHSTGARALERLVELGFLKIRQESNFNSKRLSREYEVTAIARAKAKKKTKLPEGSCEFMKWTADAIRENDAQKAAKLKAEKEVGKTNHSRMGENYSRTHAKGSADIIPLVAI